MAQFSWLDWGKPVELEDLPNFHKFVAGKDASEENRAIFQAKIRQKYKDIRYGKQSMYITIFVTVLCIGLLLLVLLLFLRKN